MCVNNNYGKVADLHHVESRKSWIENYKPLIDDGTLQLIDLNTLTSSFNGLEEPAIDALKKVWEEVNNLFPGFLSTSDRKNQKAEKNCSHDGCSPYYDRVFREQRWLKIRSNVDTDTRCKSGTTRRKCAV